MLEQEGQSPLRRHPADRHIRDRQLLLNLRLHREMPPATISRPRQANEPARLAARGISSRSATPRSMWPKTPTWWSFPPAPSGETNPEVVAARDQAGDLVIARAEMLAELMRLQSGIAVAGSHGKKPTTTSLVAQVASASRWAPTHTAVVGGTPQGIPRTQRQAPGKGEELDEWSRPDESDGSASSSSPRRRWPS